MKVSLLLGIICVMHFTSGWSQSKGDIRGFIGGVYGSDVQEAGINAGLEYLITDQIGAAPSVSFYFVDFGSFISVDIDGRYYFSRSPQIYGLFGIVIERASVDTAFGSVSDSEAGINLGLGALFPLGEKLNFHIQLKAATPGDVQAVAQAGLSINF